MRTQSSSVPSPTLPRAVAKSPSHCHTLDSRTQRRRRPQRTFVHTVTRERRRDPADITRFVDHMAVRGQTGRKLRASRTHLRGPFFADPFRPAAASALSLLGPRILVAALRSLLSAERRCCFADLLSLCATFWRILSREPAFFCASSTPFFAGFSALSRRTRSSSSGSTSRPRVVST